MNFQLRPYQTASIDSLREGFRQGHKRQILAASTGAGKSIISLSMLESAKNKGSKVLFVCDRRVLVDQFSQHLDKHGIDHGCFMAGHWRYRPQERVQVASIQTLEKMKAWPDADLIICDEIHAMMRKSLMEFMKNHEDKKILGMTATPYHPELANYFTSVTNVVSMSQLVSEGFLVPFRVFVATETDVSNLKVTAGEWQKDELEKRSLQIVGDVVSDYVRISNEVFGSPQKTIVFSSGVAHGEELVRKFAEVGLNFVQISYKDSEEYKKDVLEDFAKPDTCILGVISSDILTRGFDQTDVKHVVIAKPLRKAFSMHVQMVGRGARPHEGKEFCIASGQRVLTKRGLVPIEKVLLSDRLWDGQSFVSHEGIIYKGIKDVITYCGLTATPDHLVKTKEGWRPFGECASQQIPIVQTGLGRSAIREGEDHFARDDLEGREVEATHVCSLPMPNLLKSVLDQFQQFVSRNSWRLQEMQPAKDCDAQGCSSPGCCAASTMHKSKEQRIQGLWGQRNRVQVCECAGGISLDYGEFTSSGGYKEVSTRQDRQQRPLRSRESSLVNSVLQLVSHAKAKLEREIARIPFVQSRHPLRGSDTQASIQQRAVGPADSGEILQAELQTKREVWDILNSGPRNCFTCEDLLVHNCVIQDNAGNWLRFQEDWDEVYEAGTKSLDSGKDAKIRKEKTEAEKKQSKCPKCGHLWAGGDTCIHCGFTREKRSMIEAVPGEMEELKGVASRDEKQAFWSMCQYYIQSQSWSPGRGAHVYKEKFGVYPRSLSDMATQPDVKFDKFVKAGLIRFMKSKGKK